MGWKTDPVYGFSEILYFLQLTALFPRCEYGN